MNGWVITKPCAFLAASKSTPCTYIYSTIPLQSFWIPTVSCRLVSTPDPSSLPKPSSIESSCGLLLLHLHLFTHSSGSKLPKNILSYTHCECIEAATATTITYKHLCHYLLNLPLFPWLAIAKSPIPGSQIRARDNSLLIVPGKFGSIEPATGTLQLVKSWNFHLTECHRDQFRDLLKLTFASSRSRLCVKIDNDVRRVLPPFDTAAPKMRLGSRGSKFIKIGIVNNKYQSRWPFSCTPCW